MTLVPGQSEEVYSVGSDGLLLRWQGSSELNTDLFTNIDEIVAHEGSILCMTYSTDLAGGVGRSGTPPTLCSSSSASARLCEQSP